MSQIGSNEKDAWDEVDRQHIRETVNQFELPFQGKPRTYGQLCQHYIANELMEDQSEATIEKAFATIETYKRHLLQRIIPRWGRLAPLAIESLEVEKWFRELKRGNPKQNIMPIADPTIDKIRRVMNLVYLHGQRCNFLPRQQEGNPMNWVRQRTTSSYQALIMTPKQAFEILLNVPEPRRTLVLCDAATALRVSEILGLMWMDLDFDDLAMHVRRAYVWGRLGTFQGAQIESFEGPCSHAPAPSRLLVGLAGKNRLLERQRFRLPQHSSERH